MSGVRAAFAACLLTLSSIAPGSAAAVPDFETTAMTSADLQIYLSVMHAAADRLAHAKGDDAAAIALMRKTHGNLAAASGDDPQKIMAWYRSHQRDEELLTHALDLENCDGDIAKARGAGDRYGGIKSAVEGLMTWGGAGGASCGRGDCGGPAPTAAQIASSDAEEAARKADWALVRPHEAEIKDLLRQVRHLGATP